MLAHTGAGEVGAPQPGPVLDEHAHGGAHVQVVLPGPGSQPGREHGGIVHVRPPPAGCGDAWLAQARTRTAERSRVISAWAWPSRPYRSQARRASLAGSQSSLAAVSSAHTRSMSIRPSAAGQMVAVAI